MAVAVIMQVCFVQVHVLVALINQEPRPHGH